MPEPCSIRLDDNSRLHLVLTRSGALSVQLYKPGNYPDGHGLMLVGSAFVEGKELQALLASLMPEKQQEVTIREQDEQQRHTIQIDEMEWSR